MSAEENVDHGKGRERSGEFEPTIVFVGNLDYKTTWQRVKDIFRRAGPVRFADLIADNDGRPKGSALVTFENEAGATAAIKMFHDSEFDGRRILVRRFESGRRPAFVRHNPPEARDRAPRGRDDRERRDRDDDSDVRDRRDDRRDDRREDRREDRRDYRNEGRNEKEGRERRQDRREYVPRGEAQDVPRPRSQQQKRSEHKVFVSNLPFECTSQSLKETFEQIGKVLDATIMFSANGRSRGMGLVEFETRRDAEVAIQEFDGIEMAGRPMHVRFERSA